MIQLEDLVRDFAYAFKHVDHSKPVGKSKTRTYAPGIGPLTEAQAISAALEVLKANGSARYTKASPLRYPNLRATCDLVIPGEWAVEFKLVRPFGDNGKIAENWSVNLLHPYPGNESALGDCLKLAQSTFTERKAVLIFGFQHNEPKVDLLILVRSFEVLAEQILGIKLGPRVSADFSGLVHPFHQHGLLWGWEVLSN